MYLTQLKNVNQLAAMLKTIDTQLANLALMREKYEQRADSGGMPEHDMTLGWGICLSEYQDGANGINLNGLYLGVQMLDLTEKLLLDRKEQIEVILTDEYGVEG